MNFQKMGQSMMSESHQPSWVPDFPMSQVSSFGSSLLLPPFPGKDNALEPQHCTADSQTHTLFGVNIDSSPVLPTQVPNLSNGAIDTDVSIPVASSSFQNSLYGCMDDSSGLLQNVGQVDPASSTFVKVIATISIRKD